MTTIVFGHPYEKSFNSAILYEVTNELAHRGEQYEVLDLTKDGFNPAMRPDELRLFSVGKTSDPIAQRYIDVLLRTDAIIFIFPVWWGTEPASIKGFFDKVCLKGIAYEETPEGLKPLLNFCKTTVITTSEAPSFLFKPYFEGYMKPMMLEGTGMYNVQWLNCEGTSSASDEYRKEFLSRVREVV